MPNCVRQIVPILIGKLIYIWYFSPNSVEFLNGMHQQAEVIDWAYEENKEDNKDGKDTEEQGYGSSLNPATPPKAVSKHPPSNIFEIGSES